jgi:hypothetical protein
MYKFDEQALRKGINMGLGSQGIWTPELENVMFDEIINEALRIHDVSGELCGSFDPDNKTSSATKCKCGREKWEHPKPRN